MVTFAIIGAIVGALLGMRFRVLALVPAILGATVFIIVCDHDHDWLTTALTALATIAALQVGYMVASLFESERVPVPRRRTRFIQSPRAQLQQSPIG
jgi:hypothetical protein